ncbi:MAG: Fibronectin type domain protein, partial [Acidobacteria bacterium]|nr:Fibronectin type domain protein [Acidobacteriota bacterium]
MRQSLRSVSSLAAVALALGFAATIGLAADGAAPPADPPAEAAAPPPGNPLLAKLAAGLPEADRDVGYEAYGYTGVEQEEAELLFADAVAGVYLPELAEVVVLVNPSSAPTSMAWAAIASPSLDELPVPAPGAALGTITINGFLAELGRRFPALGNDGSERFIVKMPTVVRRPTRPAAAAALPPVAARSIVVSEGFEGDPWSRWLRMDNTSGQYTWGTTSCEARSGAYSADGVRGGTAGSVLGCGDLYPNSIENWIDDGQCENFQGASEAFLDVYTSYNAESGYDRIAFYYPDATDHYYGVGFSGNSNGWFHVIFNLRQWYSLGDLTSTNCNRLSILFESDSTNAMGFGARLDDLRIQTGPISGLTCSATASPASGAAPLTVNFTGTVTGGTGATSYSWSFDDGTTSTSQNPSHAYTAAKEYRVSFRASDGIDRCYSYIKVNVTSGGGGGGTPQAGTYTGTTSQGKAFSFTVDSSASITGWSYGFACGGSSGDMSTTVTPACPITSGSFSCGSGSCPSVGTNGRIVGTFATSTSASGTLDLAVRPTVGSSCCTATGITWSATLQGGGSGLAASASGNPTSGTAPLAVSFTGSASGGTSPYTWSWN